MESGNELSPGRMRLWLTVAIPRLLGLVDILKVVCIEFTLHLRSRFILIGLRCWFFRSMSATFSYFDGNMLKKDILRANSDVIMGVDQE
jgi:hypothetical protein